MTTDPMADLHRGVAIPDLLALLGEARVTRRLLVIRDGASPLTRLCIQELADRLPAGALLLVRGGPAFDAHGHPVAFNDSPPFAWARRFGANDRADEAFRPTMDARDKKKLRQLRLGLPGPAPDGDAAAEMAEVMPKGRNFH